ncbi:uncharacterized protein LOC111036305 isoform X2 [Myzus persicae]|nr:uncharacterized protein LOC111036305 isoform X2 [Myzus persicae]
MSNTNSSVTKLRGNETSKNHGQNQPNSDRSLQADYVASGSLHYSNPEINTLAHQHKYRGRGMAIQRLAESMASKGRMKNSNLDYSNSNIERHFNSLRDENAKKLMESNEKDWGKFIYSNRNT